MNTENPRYTMSLLCETLEVPRNGYTQWVAGKAGAREKAGVSMRQKVRESFNASRQSHDCRRVRADLQAEGSRVTQRRVARLIARGVFARPSETRLPRRAPPKAITTAPSPQTACDTPQNRTGATKSGAPTSPASPPPGAGCIWP